MFLYVHRHKYYHNNFGQFWRLKSCKAKINPSLGTIYFNTNKFYENKEHNINQVQNPAEATYKIKIHNRQQ